MALGLDAPTATSLTLAVVDSGQRNSLLGKDLQILDPGASDRDGIGRFSTGDSLSSFGERDEAVLRPGQALARPRLTATARSSYSTDTPAASANIP